MGEIVRWIEQEIGLHPELQSKVFVSLLIILVLWLLRRIILIIVSRRIDDVRILYNWRKVSLYAITTLGVLLVGRTWFQGIESLSTVLGLFSAGVAIALKDLFMNFAGWVFILVRKPFQPGDRIAIGGHAGDVIDVRIFQFTLLEIGNWVDADQSTGRILHVPNGIVFTQVLANYSKGFQFIWNEIPVLVTFESNWEKAETILRDIGAKHAEHLSAEAQERVREMSRKFMIFYHTLTPTVYTSVKDCGVMLTIRYLCNPRGRRSSSEAIWKDILKEFALCEDIDFAYPTQRFYNNILEGKEGTKSSSRDDK